MTGRISSNSADTRTGCSRRSSGRVNFRNPCTTSSSRRISLSMTSTCCSAPSTVGAAPARDSARPACRLRRPAPAAARRSALPDLRPQQLEVNHHRVQRVLHLVRDAGGQPAERDQLARVGERRLHPRQVREVARDQQHADQLAVGARDRRASSAAASSSLGRIVACTGPARAWRESPASLRRASDTGGRPAAAPCSARPMRVGRKRRLHRRIAEEQLARRVEERNGVLEVLDRRLQVGLLSGEQRPVGRELLADGVEERCRARRTRRPAAGRA